MITRRTFVRGSLAAAALFGCGGGGIDMGPILPGGDAGPDPDAGGADPDAPPESCPGDPLAGGELLGTVALLDSGSPDFGRLYGSGLDARMMTDLATVRPEAPVIPTERFYVRTSTPDALPPAAGWKVRLTGLVEQPVELSVEDIVARASDRGMVLLECAGNGTTTAFGLMSAGRWRGVPIAELLDRARPAAGAARLRIEGYDRHDGPSETSFAGAGWVFTREQLEAAGAFVATHLNDAPLTPEHGQPVRLVVPGWYGCCSIKWLREIAFVDDEEPPTFHMLEFARRVMQEGEPDKARDWSPALIDHAAMPVRVEKWRVGGKLRYLVAGILWGGDRPSPRLELSFGGDWLPVEVCPAPKTVRSWTTWATIWDPPAKGTYELRCRFDDAVRQRRLDTGYYLRRVQIDEV